MTPVDRGVVSRKLRVIAEDVELLTPVAHLTLDEFLADRYRQKAIERMLQRASEATLDTCAYLLREAGRRVPKEAREKIVAAGAAGIVPGDLAGALAPAAGLRNRLVHEYDDLDDAKVHAGIGVAVRLLPQFAAAVERYLGDD